MSEFEDFNPIEGSHFEDFDVRTETEEEVEATIETLGGLSDSENQVQSILGVRNELENLLMGSPGAGIEAAAEDEFDNPGKVVGVGIGEQMSGGAPTGQPAIKVLVKEYRPATADLVPRTLDGVAIDVEETGEIYASMYTARRRPAPCGVSIGNCQMIMAGTLGCLVTRNNQLFILSNNHVIALVGTSPRNAGIPQPGRLDGGVCPDDIIARLTQFEPINFSPFSTNTIDAAIAQTSPRLVDRRILRPDGFLQSISSGIVAPALYKLVQKSGRTTQYRRGYIDLINTTVDINYAPFGGVARFVRQFRVRGWGSIFSDRGDSGSLVTTFPENVPVGLLFAGSAARNITFCNPIRDVLASFSVSIVA